MRGSILKNEQGPQSGMEWEGGISKNNFAQQHAVFVSAWCIIMGILKVIGGGWIHLSRLLELTLAKIGRLSRRCLGYKMQRACLPIACRMRNTLGECSHFTDEGDPISIKKFLKLCKKIFARLDNPIPYEYGHSIKFLK